MSKLLDTYRRRNRPTSDYWLAGAVVAIGLIGLIMVMSSSVIVSYERFGYNYFYFGRQVAYFLIGILAMVGMSLVDYRFWRKHATTLMIIGLVLLVAVFIPGLGVKLGGAHRWIGLGSITIQPSEIIKLVFIIYLAAWLESRGKDIRDFKEGLMPFIIMVGLLGILILKQPDLGTFTIVAGIASVLVYVSGASMAHLIMLGFGGLAAFILLIRTSAYRWERFLTFLNPQNDLLGAGYQINQALLALGTGGLLGLGFGQSRQKYLYLPAPHVDSIFAVMVEELGFLRVAPIVLIYAFIVIRGLNIAKLAPDHFGKLLAVGITTWILVQAFVNIGAITGLVPLTGVPLPFISFGGTSLIMLLAGVGILLNISKQTTS